MYNTNTTGKAGTTNQGRKLPESIMNRVKACAILFLDSPRSGKINQIAESQGITVDDAAVMYTLGALKAARRRGTARNYREALDVLEAEQVGDKGSKITRTVSADNTARAIARINKDNAGNQSIPDYYTGIIDWVHMAWARMDNQPYSVYVDTYTPHYTQAAKKAESTGRLMGKVMGTLYTAWESREHDLDPVLIAQNAEMQAEQAQVTKNLTRFFAEYESRLSKTAKIRLYELVNSATKPGYLMSEGLHDPATRREAWGAYRLYESFPHKDSISGREYIELVRKYIHPPCIC